MSEQHDISQQEEQSNAAPDFGSDAYLASIEIRSEEVQEIMGYIPSWIIRWGITLIFIIIFVFLTGSVFFKYPDVIHSTITVTTENPPAAIVARTSGKLQRLFVKDNQKVNKGEFVALIETAANYQHLLDLKEKLQILKPLWPHYDTSGSLQFVNKYSLGELQSSFATFSKSYSDYHHFLFLDQHTKKIASIRLQIKRHRILYEGKKRQNAIMEAEYKISKKKFESAVKLYKEQILSRDDYQNAESRLLQQEYSLEGAHSSLKSQEITLAQLQQSIQDLELQHTDRKAQAELLLNQAYENLSGQIAQWEQNYLLKSPVSGSVAFTEFWSVNQNVKAGDTVVTIVADDAGKMIGKVVLPSQGSGKVEVGQSVNIKFLNYPHVEFGMVRGTVKSKSLVAAENNYVLEVALPKGLETSYGTVLEFSQQMQGSAEIITDDIRLIERIFKPIKSILERM